MTNTVSVASSTLDPDAGDRTATATTTVSGDGTVDLRLTGSAAPNPVVAGADLTVSWTIEDAGSSRATDVTFTHVLPGGATLRSVKPGTRCAVAGGTVTCSFGRIDPGAPMSVTEILRPTAPGTLSTTAQVARSEPDGVPGDEAATLTITVNAARPSARLWIARR